ncbi:hypothetical protein, partial [Paenibacillus solanacearum]|uniref:hypothetical protein n=1 Tax=Paenibacillus solanacearum TaxID=2048548 RepID=UPI001C404067
PFNAAIISPVIAMATSQAFLLNVTDIDYSANCQALIFRLSQEDSRFFDVVSSCAERDVFD